MTDITRKSIICMLIAACFVFICGMQAESSDLKKLPILKGDYLGQTPPGIVPEIFAPGIISTAKKEQNGSFSPDGKEFYFTKVLEQWDYVNFVMKRENNIWSEPVVSSIYKNYKGGEIFIALDGDKLFFRSSASMVSGTSRIPDIWFMKKTDKGWSKAENLGLPVNTTNAEGYPTVSRDGTLFFFSDRSDSLGGRDIYMSRLVNGRYMEPVNLGENVNSIYNEFNPCVSPDGSYIIYQSVSRPEGYGGHDLYISFRIKDGSWTKARNLGPEMNSKGSDYSAVITSDGRYIFFSSTRKSAIGSPDIYWVDAKVIEKIRSESINPEDVLKKTRKDK